MIEAIPSRAVQRFWPITTLRRFVFTLGVLVGLGLLLLLALQILAYIGQGTQLGRLDEAKAGPLLPRLPSIDELGGDGLRFSVRPELLKGRPEWALAMSAPRHGKATATVLQSRDGVVGGPVTFNVEPKRYWELVHKADGLMDWNLGLTGLCYDGVETAFERVRGGLITSGKGNCGEPYVQLRSDVRAFIQENAPEVQPPPG